MIAYREVDAVLRLMKPMMRRPTPQSRVRTSPPRNWLLLVLVVLTAEYPLKAQPQPQPRVAQRIDARAPLPKGIVSWWRGEGNGDDSIGANGACESTDVSYVYGAIGKAMDFNGLSSRLSICDSPSLQLGRSLSIEGWIYVRAFNPNGMIVMRGDRRAGLDPYFVCTTEDETLKFHIESETGSVELKAPIPLLRWVHFAGTLDDATGEMNLYVNGLLADQVTTPIRPIAALQREQGAGVGIGNHSGLKGSAVNFPYDGLIDELSLYNIALPPRQIEEIYRAGSAGKVTVPRPDGDRR